MNKNDKIDQKLVEKWVEAEVVQIWKQVYKGSILIV